MSIVVLGVYIPSDRCGKQFIIVHIDSTNKFEESLEYNNIAAIPVYVVCDNGETLHQYSFTFIGLNICFNSIILNSV